MKKNQSNLRISAQAFWIKMPFSCNYLFEDRDLMVCLYSYIFCIFKKNWEKKIWNASRFISISNAKIDFDSLAKIYLSKVGRKVKDLLYLLIANVKTTNEIVQKEIIFINVCLYESIIWTKKNLEYNLQLCEREQALESLFWWIRNPFISSFVILLNFSAKTSILDACNHILKHSLTHSIQCKLYLTNEMLIDIFYIMHDICNATKA